MSAPHVSGRRPEFDGLLAQLAEAATILGQTALSYGHTDDDLTRAFADLEDRR